MSDVEKAISGLVEDEELLEKQHTQQHQQQHLQQQQKQSTTPLNKININNYNLQNETGNTNLFQKQYRHNDIQQPQQQETNTNGSYLTAKQQNCLSRVAKLIFSTPGLVVMVVAYTIMGAFIFPLLEAPQDISKSALIAKSREDCLKELWIITEKLNVLYERNWTILVHEQLRRFEGTIVAATRNMAAGAIATSVISGAGGGAVGGAVEDYGLATETTTTSLGRYGGSNFMEYSDLTATRWSFSESLLYSVTVITTIGHGSLTPRTAGGKIATILYALIGVPLMLMCLSSLGALLADALQCTYARLCCHLPQYVVEDGDNLDHVVAQSKNTQAQRLKRQPRHTRKAEVNVGKTTTTHQIKQHLQHQCDFQEHKNGINCKNCKYDDIIGETNGNHGYDYKLCNDATTTAKSVLSSVTAATSAAVTTTTNAMTTMKLGHKEDCCQLLQSSPGKFTQHLSSCMQLKMSPIMASSAMDTTTAQQQQHQQYYQQRPDVMLMTTGHKLSSQQQPAAMTPACSMVLPPMLPPSQSQRFYASATPAMATYHIVSSASANSSPTDQQSIRHYIVPQIPPPPSSSSPLPTTSLTSVTGTQHFMAVPSTMIRFHQQTSPQTSIQQPQQQQCSVNTTSNININPLALPVSGSATVYFPIVTPAAVGSQNTTHQPLVKYHTIQMPHKRQHGLSLFQQTDLHDNQVITAVEDVDGTTFPLPPPPAYQTATVHGIRRAKFLTKPLPQEINTLLHESDISCRHDLSQNFKTFTNSNNMNLGGEQQQQQQQQPHLITTAVYTPATHPVMLSNENGANATETSMSAATTAVSNFYGSSNASTSTASSSSPASTATLTNNTNSNNTTTNIYENQESATIHSLQSQQTHVVNNQTALMLETGGIISEEAAAATVDIMEDEEEQEQQRLGNCPHGTPSRVPLLTSSVNSTEDKSHARSFLNATAASFHRHTLNTFQRSSSSLVNQRKSIIINRKGECNLHIPRRRNSFSATICYGDQYDDNSDDECVGLEGANIYELKHLHSNHSGHCQTDKHLVQADFCDNHSLVSLSESASQIPQVPIIVVLFILTFYVCLGTVIFALWENWSLIDGAYFCFVTLTTIGYGDFVPWQTFRGPEIQLFACCAYLLLGLVLVAMSFSILETQLIWKCKRLAVRLKLAKE